MADSFEFEGANPAVVISAAWIGSSAQSLFDLRSAPFALRSSRVGSGKGFAMPKELRLGPSPRRITRSLPLLLPRVKPAMATLLPGLTNARVLRLASFEAAALSRS